MKTLDIDGLVMQKFAAFTLTERLLAYFKLHPHSIAHDVNSIARKAGVTPIELIGELEKVLPLMMAEAIATTKAILVKEQAKASKAPKKPEQPEDPDEA